MTYFSLASFSTASDLYSWIQLLSPESTIIECGQLHRAEHLVLCTSPSPLAKPPAAKDFFCSNLPSEALVRAYYKQNSIALKAGLLILEADHLSTLFSCVLEDLKSLQDSLLEISRSALPDGKATAIYVNISPFNAQTISKDIKATYFEKVNLHLLSLFNL